MNVHKASRLCLNLVSNLNHYFIFSYLSAYALERKLGIGAVKGFYSFSYMGLIVIKRSLKSQRSEVILLILRTVIVRMGMNGKG